MTDTYYAPRPGNAQVLGMSAGLNIPALEMVKTMGAGLVRGGGGWTAVEGYETGTLNLGTRVEEAVRWCAQEGIDVLMTAAYGPPYKKLLGLTVAADVPLGSLTLAVNESSLAAIKVPYDYITHAAVTEYNFTRCGSYYGSLIVGADPGGKTITLAAKTTRELRAGDVLHVHRLRYPPPQGRDRQQPSISMYKRYATFLATEIVRLGAQGYVSLWNEPQWFLDPWVPGLLAFYETPTAEQREQIGSGGMHTILAAFFGSQLPDGVRFISGATDKCGAYCSVLHQYMKDVVGNKGDNYIAPPTPAQLEGWLAAEGAHPGAGQLQPETQGWNENYEILNPIEKSSSFRLMRQRQEVYGKAHGYDIKMFATEAGGVSEKQPEDRAACHILRRIVSYWSMGVPLACVGLSMLTTEEGEEKFVPHQGYAALRQLMSLMPREAGGDPAGCPKVLATGPHDWPLMVCPFYGGDSHVTFVWQRTHSQSRDRGWYTIKPPAPIDVAVEGSLRHAVNVRTAQPCPFEATNTGWRVGGITDDVIALVS